MKKKKILFIIWSFTYGGGAEKVLADLVNKMDFNKYEIDIIEYWHSDIKNQIVDSRVNILNPIVNSLTASKIRMFITKILLEHFPKILRKKYITKKYDYEISFNYMIPTFLLDKNAKTISWIHTDIYDLNENKRNKKLQNKAFKHIDKIVAISENTYNSIVDVFPQYKDKTSIINNSFDFEMIDKLSNDKIDIKKTKFTLLFAGRFDDRKNPLYLIEAANVLKKQNIDFQIWFIGRGNLQNEMEERINKNDLNDNIKILGFQQNSYPFFKNCDAVVMSSHAEGFPTVLAEGLYLNKPFVSTNVGGVKELSDSGKCGLISNTFDEFVDNLIKIINDKELYTKMSNHAKKHISQFTYKNQIKKLENLFKELDTNE